MLNIISPINQLGYGIAGLNIVKELDKIAPVSLFPIGQPSVTSQDDYDILTETIRNSKMPNYDAPCLRIWHQHDMSQFVGNSIKAGFPIFELDKFNDMEKHHLSHPDKVFVCSQWAKDIIIDQVNISSNDVHIAPLGVDTNLFPEVSLDNEDIDGTIFFNCGKWEVRKGHDVLPDIFNKAFTPSDNVELWMMCENPFVQGEEKMKWIDKYKSTPMGDKIRILDRVETQAEVYNIMSTVDCGVFPSRAEGWNLEALEMMSCGKPVIITDFSAHTEFCTKENSFLIPINSTEEAVDGKWFHGQGNWANFGEDQIEATIEHMRYVHKNKVRTNQEGVATAKKFSWRNTAESIMKALDINV